MSCDRRKSEVRLFERVAVELELSDGQTTRQALVLGGVPQQRIARIEGVAETEPLIGDDPADPRNRRISLLLLEGRGAGARAVNRPAAVAKAAP
jgi:chemotaxis protein MotB